MIIFLLAAYYLCLGNLSRQMDARGGITADTTILSSTATTAAAGSEAVAALLTHHLCDPGTAAKSGNSALLPA